jgi:hypothetical protein
MEHELSFLLNLLSSDYERFRDRLQFIPTRPKLDGVSLDATISAVQYKDSAHCLKPVSVTGTLRIVRFTPSYDAVARNLLSADIGARSGARELL